MPDPAEIELRELIDRAQRGERDALDELLRRHLPALRAYVRANSDPKLRLRESNSDLVQSVCRDVLAGIDRYEWRGDGSFRHWLFSVALSTLRGKRKFHRAEKRDVGREVAFSHRSAVHVESLAKAYLTLSTPSQYAVAAELVDHAEAALDSLPEQYREVILLSRVVGLSHQEIARQLGKNEAAVRAQLHRALARLATAMDGLS